MQFHHGNGDQIERKSLIIKRHNNMNALKLILFIVALNFASNVSAQEVYTTKTGEKYHKSTCRYLKYSKYKVSLEKAIQLGYEACSVCKPSSKVNKSNNTSASTLSSNSSSKTTSTSKKATATQCIGKTKAGARCKRKTKNANGRCYQHQ